MSPADTDPTQHPALLIELFTEELPPKSLQTLGDAFGALILKSLKQRGHVSDKASLHVFATPRRLACRISRVLAQTPASQHLEKLLPASIGLDAAQNPTAPLLKKLDALGLNPDAIANMVRQHDGKHDVLYVPIHRAGHHLSDSLNSALHDACTQLPIPKMMSYQQTNGDTIHFVRPAHGLVALHGEHIVPCTVLGLEAGRDTEGHRFMAGRISIPNANAYETTLEQMGKVVASFGERKKRIQTQLQHMAQEYTVVAPDALIDEVCALVEWPVVYAGQFEEHFLQVPQNCLILTMQANQKYFALTAANGQMHNRFLLVSNLETPTPEHIIKGNERVLRARLADAQFFYQQDCKTTLQERTAKLSQVVYHNQLGTQKDRQQRLMALAEFLAPLCGADPQLAMRAALLCKADLVSDMVGEFPELQGEMGRIYALHDGEPPQVAQAIEDHYKPRFAGDVLPTEPTSVCLALVDKFETLVGIWGVGLAPTGEKDPFALRRHAIGIVRTLLEKQLALNVPQVLAFTASLFTHYPTCQPNLDDIFQFILERMRNGLKDQYSAAQIDAVLALQPETFADIPERLKAVKAFTALPESQALAAANKRISNILKKADNAPEYFDATALTEPAEHELAVMLQTIQGPVHTALQQQQFTQALLQLAPLKTSVDVFFNDVMVNDPDPQKRSNRLGLLRALHTNMNAVADLSLLAI